MKTLYLIGGTMGVGKTTVCQQLKKELPQSVFLDGDWCWDADPFQITDETKAMVVDNIIDSITEKLDVKECRMKCISLIADESSLRERLSADVSKGIRTADVMERSVARIPLYQELDTIKIDTNGKTVRMIVDELKGIEEKRYDES